MAFARSQVGEGIRHGELRVSSPTTTVNPRNPQTHIAMVRRSLQERGPAAHDAARGRLHAREDRSSEPLSGSS